MVRDYEIRLREVFPRFEVKTAFYVRAVPGDAGFWVASDFADVSVSAFQLLKLSAFGLSCPVKDLFKLLILAFYKRVLLLFFHQFPDA